MRVTRLWGALVVAVLATAAQYFDVVCEKTMGTSLGSVSLLLIVGLINSCIRQVCLIQSKRLCLLRPAQICLQKHALYMFGMSGHHNI